MDTEALEEIGLTRNEAAIYITLLDLGKSNISNVSEKTKMHRRTIYDCIERLEDRGLASHVIEGKTRYFKAISPEKLLDIVKGKKAKIEGILPKLLQIANRSKSKTEVSVHTGKEGLKSIMEDILKTKPRVWLSITSSGKASLTIPFYLNTFHDKRVKEKIQLNIIFGKNPEAIHRSKNLIKYPFTKGKFLDTKYVIPLSLWIYENKTVFMLWESETGIVIESRETANTFRKYFNILWIMAKE